MRLVLYLKIQQALTQARSFPPIYSPNGYLRSRKFGRILLCDIVQLDRRPLVEGGGREPLQPTLFP